MLWWQNNLVAGGGQPFEPLKLFTVTPIGIALLLTAILYFMIGILPHPRPVKIEAKEGKPSTVIRFPAIEFHQ